MGLDLGSKTIGVAVSDALGLTAQPLTTIKRISTEKDIEEIKRLVGEYSVTAFVVGLPVHMDGTVGESSRKVLDFVELLKTKTGLPVSTWDERLSTIAVTKVLIEGDVSRKKRKKAVDKLAAAYILQGYLDSRRM